ncbi:alpha/beta hydrolase family protein [Lunatibacter salilacus]|uniref:alpha/beta hydrolase family protein n=1 Tax=Lunatibacter salilacus TaxID=2483804 RepID=UPI00131D0456|nr:alpha/beta fold hydrolase [Lunatibacter salilacus]
MAQGFDTLPASKMVKIATFDVDASPPIGSQLAYDPMEKNWDLGLKAKGIVLVGKGMPIVLCAVDWIGIANESQDAFKEGLARAAGTIPSRVAIHTLHQHDAPISDFGAEKILKDAGMDPQSFEGSFSRQLITNLEIAITDAMQNMKTVTHVGKGKAQVHQVASNRRIEGEDGKIVFSRTSSTRDSTMRAHPEGLIDPDVSLVSFWNGEEALAVLSYYAVHPQSYYLTKVANPDFPGVARFLRQMSLPDALHVHFNGAGANVTAGKYNDGSKENRLKLAERLADGMRRAWENTVKLPISANDLGWDFVPVSMEPKEGLEKIRTEMETQNHRWLTNNLMKLAWYNRQKEGKKIDISCLYVGDVRILHLPGELFVEYQLAAKEERTDLFVAMAAYGDYGPFYIGPASAYPKGGYEINVSPVTEKAEAVLMGAIKNLLHKDFPASETKGLLFKKDGSPITKVEEWKAKKTAILENFQKVTGPLPLLADSPPLSIQYLDSLQTKDYIRYSILYTAAVNEEVPAYLYLPSKTKKNQKKPGMLVLHGTGDLGKQLVDGKSPLANRATAKELAMRGYVVIAPDYPSMGDLSDYDFENDRYESATMKAIVNHYRAVDLLQSLEEVDPEKIGVIGHSLGGHNSIFVAAFDERIKVVVSSCGWTPFDFYNIGTAGTKRYGGRLGPWAQIRYMPKVRNYMEDGKLPFDFPELISTLAPRAFYSNSPLNDSNFDVVGVKKGIEQVQEVFNLFGVPQHLQVRYPEAEHDFPTTTRLEAYQFIDKHLQFKPKNIQLE